MSTTEGTATAATLPRVLVIDDDPHVGAAIQRCLHGFQVTFTQSATGALGRILAGGDFQVVLCDVFMPGLSGIQFHGELLREAPQVARRLVFITGAISDEVEAYVRRQQVPCMAKPFTGPELRATVNAISLRRN
jgi:CheY-like chemotaxis protein